MCLRNYDIYYNILDLIGCSKEDVYQLTITNNVVIIDNFEIRSVSLVGHNFNDLAMGESKTFALNEIQGGADNTNISFEYWCVYKKLEYFTSI